MEVICTALLAVLHRIDGKEPEICCWTSISHENEFFLIENVTFIFVERHFTRARCPICICFWDIELAAPIMVKRRAAIPSIDVVGPPQAVSVRVLIDDRSCSARYHWIRIPIIYFAGHGVVH